MIALSKTQIDKLGERIRRGVASEDDLRLLAAYRDSFRDAYLHVTRLLMQRARIEVTGRTKSNLSIERKVVRESHLRLSQMQDIEGCRIVVPDHESQQVHLMIAEALFSDAKVDDRRERPSHGYRAVHVIVTVDRRAVEVQIRTILQDLWAQLCERLADELNEPDIKYGGGSPKVRQSLRVASERIAEIEKGEQAIFIIDAQLDLDPASVSQEIKDLLPSARGEIDANRAALMTTLGQSIAILQRAKMSRNPVK
jgi:ppGpp synthetase/RelA/SpoT-type nucleotidyltranferase